MASNKRKGVGSFWDSLEYSLFRFERLVHHSTALLGALAILGSQVVFLIGLSAYYSPENLPDQCASEIESVIDLPPVDAANELFWRSHPELNRRQIRANEKKLMQEWWKYYRAVQACKNSSSLP